MPMWQKLILLLIGYCSNNSKRLVGVNRLLWSSFNCTAVTVHGLVELCMYREGVLKVSVLLPKVDHYPVVKLVQYTQVYGQ